jgi:hypothetical protein
LNPFFSMLEEGTFPDKMPSNLFYDFMFLRQSLYEDLKRQRELWEKAGSPPGPFPTLEQTTAALEEESRNSATKAATSMAVTATRSNSAAAPRNSAAAPRNSAAAPRNSATRSNSAAVTTVAPSSTKITWAAVAARK